MKKILIILITILFLPVIVNAKEYCEIISGNGKNIGSEIKCGTESFYIVSSNNNTIQMLAKYNLGVGDKIDYFDYTNEKTYTDVSYTIEGFPSYSEQGNLDCQSYASEKGYSPYYVKPIFNENRETAGNGNTLKGCRVYETMNPDKIRQDERAIGTKLVNGKSILPLYGIVYLNNEWGYDHRIGYTYGSYEYDSNGNLILEGTESELFLNGYKDELISQDINVSDVSFITLDNTLKLLKDISGKDTIIGLEYPANYTENEFYYGKMDIKEYINNNNWIHSTTYWLGSGFYGDEQNPYEDIHNDYYISNEGFLCALGRGECKYLPYPIGNGIRPLVTITKDNFKYKIKTKTDGKGTIEVIDTAHGGETITFRVTNKKGYKLSSLTIITDSGEKVTFNEDDIKKNTDGTITISINSFTMPYENITIQARWTSTIKNPVTKTAIGIILFTMTIIFSLLIYANLSYNNNQEE